MPVMQRICSCSQKVPSEVEGARTVLDHSAIEKDLLERRGTKESVCSKYGLDQRGTDQLHQVYPWEYLISKEHSLVWCNVFKSASSRYFNTSSWMERSCRIPVQFAVGCLFSISWLAIQSSFWGRKNKNRPWLLRGIFIQDHRKRNWLRPWTILWAL